MASIDTLNQHAHPDRHLDPGDSAPGSAQHHRTAIEPTTTEHNNNFGALRLIFAYAVIFSHAPEMLDGNRLREPLTALGSHLTLGGVAVDGFFIISGYLVASSYLSGRSLATFLINRVLRIYPAFIIASLVCIFLVGPLAGGHLTTVGERGWVFDAAKLFLLHSPDLPGAFATLHFPALDGAMWTIRYEFYCYLLVGFLGMLGILDRKITTLVITGSLYATVICFSVANPGTIHPGLIHKLVFGVVGDPMILLMLIAIFMSGVCYRLFREKIKLSGRDIIFLMPACAALLLIPVYAEAALAPVFTCVLLWTGIQFKSRFLQSVNNKYDFSYGVYLYAWPIASLLILYVRPLTMLSPLAVAGATSVLATMAGALSWYALEKPMLKLKRGFRRLVRHHSSLKLETAAPSSPVPC